MADKEFMKFPSRDDCKFALLGSGKALCNFVQLLSSHGFKAPVIVTHPRDEHQRDKRLYSDTPHQQGIFEDVFTVSEAAGIEVFETKNMNDSPSLEWLEQQKPNVALSFGCRSIIRKNFIDFFDNRVLNYHAAELPRYQGAGSFTWQILNGETSYVAGTLHIIDETIDTGGVLLRGRKDVVIEHPYPADLFRVSIEVINEVLTDFLEKIAAGENIATTPQDLSNGVYFPRLYTEINGAIDWTWGANHIERFIRGFGYPYPGAWTYIESQKIYIARSRLAESNSEFHPFVAGLIFREYEDGSVEVATGDSSLIIESIRSEDREIPANSKLKVGHRVHTPTVETEGALLHRHRY